jgi:hypothetical protein
MKYGGRSAAFRMVHSMARWIAEAAPRFVRGVRHYAGAHSAAAYRHVVWRGAPITSWADFHTVVKTPDRPLLGHLDEFRDSLLIAGCQRSGTTAVARLFKRANGIADCDFGQDDELDAALLLSGWVQRFTSGRHCFQTTYLNDRYYEYFEHADFRLIWMVREPRSVVYSMLHNWKRGSLNRLYDACASVHDDTPRAARSVLTSWIGPSRLDKACASYTAKTEQTHELRQRLGDRIMIVDYDDLVLHREVLLPRLFEFAGIELDARLLKHLHGKSVRKGNNLAEWEAARVAELCAPAYQRARDACTIGSAHGA